MQKIPNLNDTRGYEHVVDLLLFPDSAERRMDSFARFGIDPHQVELIGENIGQDSARAVASLMAKLAIDDLQRRIYEERLSLESVGMLPFHKPSCDRRLVNSYIDTAGDPEQLADFFKLCDLIATSGLYSILTNRMTDLGRDIVDVQRHQGRTSSKFTYNYDTNEFRTDPKGLSFELAAALELGDLTYRDGIRRLIESLPGRLGEAGMCVQLEAQVPTNVLLKPIKPKFISANSPLLLRLYNAYPVANVKTLSGGLMHVAGRSSYVTVLNLLPVDLQREIIRQQIDYNGPLSDFEFESTVTDEVDMLRSLGSSAILPATTTIYTRHRGSC